MGRLMHKSAARFRSISNAMKLTAPCALIGLSLAALSQAKETPPAAEATTSPIAAATSKLLEAATPKSPAEKEQEELSAKNKLEAERLIAETSALRAEISKLKIERELITEKLAFESAKRGQAKGEALLKIEDEKDILTQQGELAKLKADKLANDLKAIQTEALLETTRLQGDISRIETADKRSKFADAQPKYLENPLRDDGVLVISDRRIPLNGMIVPATADFITSRIDYWNNKDSKLPIFIVIDDCPGGSVMAGYRILKSMEASQAPIHVVVKSFAASMAACITTLAKESSCYPNSLILHHQISAQLVFARLNLTQQKEFYEESNRWWDRLASPVAAKMGVSTVEFIKRM